MTTQSGGLGELAGRIKRKYQLGGWRAIVASLNGRYEYWLHKQKVTTPVAWTRLGAASVFLAKALKPQQPPVLVLSLPRSGSTWVGETLGSAANALYLAEPINQSRLARGLKHDFMVEPLHPPREYAAFADLAFAGCPAFRQFMVKVPGQWSLLDRVRRRVVIKEVLVAACGWLVRRYRPRVLLLVRHPAAVSLSYMSLKWSIAKPGSWNYQGAFQGSALRAALDALAGYDDCRVVVYEELCADPVAKFRELFDFAGLRWDSTIGRLIRQRSSGGDRENVWGTSRDSRGMIDAWRGRVAVEELEELRAAYSAFDLPWYRSSDDW